MTQLQANGINLEVETFGDTHAKPLLLVMGLGAQLIHWRTEFCQLLADAGHYVIRYDNRDAGLSEKFDAAGVPSIQEVMVRRVSGQSVELAYTLSDLSDDAFGVLDALNIDKAHICGASMGGMIVQTQAIAQPERVLSMTSIMSTTANPELPAAKPEAMAALLSPPASNRKEAIERGLSIGKVIGSPGYPEAGDQARERVAEAYDRSAYTDGVARQMSAIIMADNRRPALEKISVPTLVIHGSDDPLVPVEGGIDTHEAIQGSELMLIKGMGHNLPEPLWEQIVTGITALTSRSQ